MRSWGTGVLPVNYLRINTVWDEIIKDFEIRRQCGGESDYAVGASHSGSQTRRADPVVADSITR